MAWTAPRTWVTSEIVTASVMNTHVRDNLNMLWYEVAYVEFTSSKSVTTSYSEGSPLDIVSAGTLTLAAVPTLIEFFAPGVSLNTNSGGYLGLSLWDGTDIGRVASISGASSVNVSYRLTPSAGSHTYKIRGWTNGVNNQGVTAGAGGAATDVPGFIRVSQRGSA